MPLFCLRAYYIFFCDRHLRSWHKKAGHYCHGAACKCVVKNFFDLFFFIIIYFSISLQKLKDYVGSLRIYGRTVIIKNKNLSFACVSAGGSLSVTEDGKYRRTIFFARKAEEGLFFYFFI